MSSESLLFSEYDWFSVSENQKDALRKEVAEYEGNRLLNTSVEDLCDYFVEKFRIDVPALDREGIVAEQRETQIDVSNDFRYARGRREGVTVPGAVFRVTVPFEGEAVVFRIRPTSFTLNPPRVAVSENYLQIPVSGIDLTAEQVKTRIESTLSDIDSHLSTLRGDASALNDSLPGIARSAINARREKLLANQSLVASLGYRLRESEPDSRTYAAPNVRRKLKPTPPQASSLPYEPEPALSNPDYEHVLGVMQNMAEVMERSPSAFKGMNEETLRTHFLVQLNGHYEGEATGETFNYEGKTDILIRSEGKNIFIAECKFWGGAKKLTATLDQLLRYSAWRDTKVAVLVFNRNKSLSSVLQSIQETIPAHPNCKREVSTASETWFRYVFSHRDDENRELTLTVLAFDVPH